MIKNIIADEKGRFSFDPPEGKLMGEAHAVRFVFPSSIVSGNYDDFYGMVYHGEVFDGRSRGKGDMNCPVDPLQLDTPAVKKLKIVSFIGKIIFFFGTVWSIYATYANPAWYNITICLLYGIVICQAIYFSYKRAVEFGLVRSSDDGKPIKNVWLYLIDSKTGQIVDKRLTNETGKYQLYALPGQFLLKAMHNVYKPVEIEIPYYSKERVIHENIWMEKIKNDLS